MKSIASALLSSTKKNSKDFIIESVQPKILFAVIATSMAIIGLTIYLAIRWSPISVDAAYYLVIAREIANGVTPYSQIEVVYTPVAVYLNSIPFALFKGFNYSNFIVVQLGVVAGCAVLLYLILYNKFNLAKWISSFLSIIFFAAILSFEGYYIVTEPYVIFFVLLSFYFIYNSTSAFYYIIGGVTLAFAFFSKQYGLFAVAPFVMLTFFQTDKKANTIYFITAYSLAILVFFVLFSNGDMAHLFNQLFASPFTKKSKKLLSIPGPFSLLIVAKVFLLLMVPFFIRILKKPFQKNYMLGFSLCGIVIFCLPILINQNQHHFINTLPFVFIGYGYTIKKTPLASFEYLLMGILFLLFSFLTINRLRIHAYKKGDQFKVAHQARQVFNNGESVFLMGQYRNLYLLNNYQNPLKQVHGYTWDYKRIEENKNELENKNIIFSFCYEKQLFIDSLDTKPARYLIIEDCNYPSNESD